MAVRAVCLLIYSHDDTRLILLRGGVVEIEVDIERKQRKGMQEAL
jgi:hypothetical protein